MALARTIMPSPLVSTEEQREMLLQGWITRIGELHRLGHSDQQIAETMILTGAIYLNRLKPTRDCVSYLWEVANGLVEPED